MHPALLQFRDWIRSYPLYCLPGFQVLATFGHIQGVGQGLTLLNAHLPSGLRSQGHGRSIMAKLLEIADAYDLPVALEASESSDSAAWIQSWYARRGFEPTGERGNYGPVMVRAVNNIFAA